MPENELDYNPDLGVDFDFAESDEDIGTDEVDNDLLAQSLADTQEPAEEQPETPEPNIDGDDKPPVEDPPVQEDLEDELDVNKHFEKLLKEGKNIKSDDPSTADKGDEPSAEGTKETNKNSGSFSTVTFGKVLQERGLSDFNEEEYLKAVEEKGEAEAFLDLLEKNADTVANNKLGEVDNYTKEYVEFRNAGFTREEAQNLVSTKEQVESITDDHISEDESLQESIVRQVSQLRGMTEDETEENLQLLKDTDKLKDRASNNIKTLKTYYSKLADHQLKQKQADEAKKTADNEQYLQSLKDKVYNTEEILKGQKIDKTTKDKLFDTLTKPVKDGDIVTNKIWAKRNQDRQQFDLTLAYLVESGFFDGEAKALTNSARTKALKDLKQTLDSTRKFSSGAPNLGNPDNSIEDKLSEMEGFMED